MNAPAIVKAKLPLAFALAALGVGVWRQYPTWEIAGLIAVAGGAAIAIGAVFEAFDRLQRDIGELRLAQVEHRNATEWLKSEELKRQAERDRQFRQSVGLDPIETDKAKTDR